MEGCGGAFLCPRPAILPVPLSIRRAFRSERSPTGSEPASRRRCPHYCGRAALDSRAAAAASASLVRGPLARGSLPPAVPLQIPVLVGSHSRGFSPPRMRPLLDQLPASSASRPRAHAQRAHRARRDGVATAHGIAEERAPLFSGRAGRGVARVRETLRQQGFLATWSKRTNSSSVSTSAKPA